MTQMVEDRGTSKGQVGTETFMGHGVRYRDSAGHFLPGNPGGPGNPFARQTTRLRQVILDSVSEQDMAEVMEALKVEAKKGKQWAIKLLFQYTIGKPLNNPHPIPVTADEGMAYEEEAQMAEEAVEVVTKSAGEMPAELARVVEEGKPEKVVKVVEKVQEERFNFLKRQAEIKAQRKAKRKAQREAKRKARR